MRTLFVAILAGFAWTTHADPESQLSVDPSSCKSTSNAETKPFECKLGEREPSKETKCIYTGLYCDGTIEDTTMGRKVADTVVTMSVACRPLTHWEGEENGKKSGGDLCPNLKECLANGEYLDEDHKRIKHTASPDEDQVPVPLNVTPPTSR